jgi:hypothetical protein
MNVAILVIVLGALLTVGAVPDAAAQPKPEGELRWALYITISPNYFDPGEVVGQLTPFWFLYAMHDALVKPMPGNHLTPSLAESWERRQHQRPPRPRAPAPAPRPQAITPPAPYAAPPLEPQAQRPWLAVQDRPDRFRGNAIEQEQPCGPQRNGRGVMGASVASSAMRLLLVEPSSIIVVGRRGGPVQRGS